MLLSWLVLTNHCALAAMAAASVGNTGHAHCHAVANHGGKTPPQDGVRECCRDIKASLAQKTVVKLDATSCELLLWGRDAVALVTECSAPKLLREHGPPRAISFAEIVLRHSLLSHAPPFYA